MTSTTLLQRRVLIKSLLYGIKRGFEFVIASEASIVVMIEKRMSKSMLFGDSYFKHAQQIHDFVLML